jgi:hypothetical protein
VDHERMGGKPEQFIDLHADLPPFRHANFPPHRAVAAG